MAGGKNAGKKKSSGKDYKNKKYKKGYGKKNIEKIVENTLMKKFDVEKKRFNTTYATTDATMGQCDGNANAYYANEITPNIPQDDTPNGRTGNKISLCSLFMTLQLRQMSSATSPTTIKCFIIRAVGSYADTPANLVGQLWNANNYIGSGNTIYDTGSDMNIDQFANFRILKRFNCYIKPDQLSGQQMPIARDIGMKFKKPLEIVWRSNAVNTQVQGRLYFIALASNGNASLSTQSTLANVPVVGTNTGQFINYNIKWYYTDM